MTAPHPPDAAALLAEVERLRLQIASLPGLLWTADASGGLDYPGPQWQEFTGLDPATLRGEGWLAVVHPDDRALALAAWQDALRNRAAFTVEHRFRRHDGSYRWFAVRASPASDASGQVRWYGSCTDIDALKQAEAELHQRQIELEGFFRQAATGLAVVDPDRGIVRINQRFCDIVGYSEAELIGLDFATITHPDDLKANLELFERLLAGEIQEYSYEKRYCRKQGGWVWVAMSVALARNEETGRPFIISVVQDIDRRKHLEAELRQAHQELEERVAQRTAELEEAREAAEAARQLAEAANRAKSEFLATMSHEIRTPLNGVIGFNGLLLDGPLTEDKRRYAELARRSGESLLHLLNDFLDFSKIEAGRLALEPVAFDLAQEIGHVLTLVSAEAHGKGLDLTHNIEAPMQLLGDAARLRQILLNLLGNAVKFTEHGRISLCCEEVLRTGGETWICCQVSDTGIGIDPSARDRLFQPFVQADASTTRRFGGTGLGLAICKRLAVAMGGKIGFSSTPGVGSTFWVELPFTLLEPSPVLSTEAAFMLPELPEGRPRGRVLVVEDNPVSQLLAAEIFRRLGCQVDVVGNGKEAVDAFRRLPYDIIFMDCDMPVMNGYDATCAIRALAQPGEHVPIVAMTASVLQGDVERCIAVGMDDFMSKPLRLQQLATTVDKWLRPTASQPPLL